MAEGQTVDAEELGNDAMGNALSEVLPDQLLLPAELGLLRQAALGSAEPLPLGFPAG